VVVRDWRAEKLCPLIEDSPSAFGDQVLKEFARQVRVSTSRLRHLFKQQVGFSPGQYAKRLKLQLAAELFESAPLRIKEVLDKVGLKGRSRFSRDFKRAFGASPRAYRDQVARHALPRRAA
jgi:AraC-like DNA-binding protein